MVMYHTIRLTAVKDSKTNIFDLETRESNIESEDLFAVINTFNKKGYTLTAVNQSDYFLTKRFD